MGLLDLTVVEMKMYFSCWPEGKKSDSSQILLPSCLRHRSFSPRGQFLIFRLPVPHSTDHCPSAWSTPVAVCGKDMHLVASLGAT